MHVATRIVVACLSSVAFAATLSQQTIIQHPKSCDNIHVSDERYDGQLPAPPEPESIIVNEVPLPPVTPNNNTDSCTPKLNPHRTGCVGKAVGLQSGSFLPDGNHIVAKVTFEGAPAAPDPASIYAGDQIIIIKVDGTVFPNGDSWKCVTCRIPKENIFQNLGDLGYPQTFADGKRLLVGANIIDCSPHDLTSWKCTPESTYSYPIHWRVNRNDSGPGGEMRELRLHPDNLHLGFSSFSMSQGRLNQFGYFARLVFNPSPTTGTPLAPRYELENVTRLFDPKALQPITLDGEQMHINPDAITVGELRGFTGRGDEVVYVGYPAESSNIDIFAAHLQTGKVRRLTSHPEYVDPVDFSPDGEWMVVLDTRGSGRQMFMAGMRNIPPIIDMITTSVTASTRNNGQRRFFQPYLLDQYGDRGSYFGQRINAAGGGIPGSGSVNDPEWNGMADPRWSPDGTRVVYWQAMAVPPACGGENPLPCYNSTEPGGRTQRIMLAHLADRKPKYLPQVSPVADDVPWGTAYIPGDPDPEMNSVPQGNYTLKGKASGSAQVTIVGSSDQAAIETVAVTYHNFSNDGINVLVGTERVTARALSFTLNHLDWYSDLIQTGRRNSTKKTSPDGFHIDIDLLTNIFEANGTLTTTIDGCVFSQPLNGA